jgi:hypothetical protein
VFSAASALENLLSVALAKDNDLSKVPSGATSRPFKLFYSLPQSTTTSPLKPFFYLEEDSADIFSRSIILYAAKE